MDGLPLQRKLSSATWCTVSCKPRAIRFHIDVEVRYTKAAGRAIFPKRTVLKDTMIHGSDRDISFESASRFRTFLKCLHYTFWSDAVSWPWWDTSQKVTLALSPGSLINHADNANCEADDDGQVYANRNFTSDEPITDNYSTFNELQTSEPEWWDELSSCSVLHPWVRQIKCIQLWMSDYG